MSKRKSKESKESKAEKPKKRRGRRVRRLLFLGIVGGGLALALSEDLRNKVLDKLFGAEEQFQYTPPAEAAAGNGAPPSAPSTPDA